MEKSELRKLSKQIADNRYTASQLERLIREWHESVSLTMAFYTVNNAISAKKKKYSLLLKKLDKGSQIK